MNLKQRVSPWRTPPKGIEDILYKLNLVGTRDEVSGFTPTDEEHKLFNIEIVGADHLDYLRREETSVDACTISPASDACWNAKVSAFVTDLIINSTSPDVLNQFLTLKQLEGIASKEGDTWVIRLPE